MLTLAAPIFRTAIYLEVQSALFRIRSLISGNELFSGRWDDSAELDQRRAAFGALPA